MVRGPPACQGSAASVPTTPEPGQPLRDVPLPPLEFQPTVGKRVFSKARAHDLAKVGPLRTGT